MKARFTRALFADFPVKLICLTAAAILFLFHRANMLTERFFSVPLEVSVPAGFAVASSHPRSVRITLRGAEEAIFPILEEDVLASVNLDGRKSEGVYRAPVKVNRRGTALNVEPLEIKVEPQEITFTLEPLLERRVQVKADVKGSPVYGFEVVQSILSPPSVVVRGARSNVLEVTSLATEEIDLTGRSASFTAPVRIILPPSLAETMEAPRGEFRATIQEVIVVKEFGLIEIVSLELPLNLRPRTALPSGSVQLQGTQLAMDEVRPEQVRLILDCSAVRRQGTYVLQPKAEAPSGLTVLDYQPGSVEIEFVPIER